MTEPLFITQSKLEEWIDNGEVLFEDNTLTIFAENVSYKLEPAIRVISLLDGSDERSWLGRVFLVADVQAQGAEHLSDSVIVGNTAYQCEEGFSCRPGQQPTAQASAAPPPADPGEPASPPQSAPPAEASTVDLLTDFLLKHM